MKRVCLIIVILTVSGVLFANSAPVVSAVTAAQRGDDSKLVDIYYNLADADGDACTVWVSVSDSAGLSWRVPADNFSGAVGQGITPGTNKHITWDAGGDMPGKAGTFKVRVFADDGKGPDSMVVVPAGSFAYQNNYTDLLNLPAFIIAKYETTVSQYCQFLNSADPDGTYWHSGQEIIKKGDPGNYYYEVQEGRDNYPVRYVSAYDAEAYAAWKSSTTGLTYRLPTEQEWEKAAGWNPITHYLWTYGYQSNSVSCNYMNCSGCYLAELRPVGYYNGVNPNTSDARSYYGCYDMSGNLWEWTSSMYDASNRVLRGGSWNDTAYICSVTYRSTPCAPSSRHFAVGFHLVLDLD